MCGQFIIETIISIILYSDKYWQICNKCTEEAVGGNCSNADGISGQNLVNRLRVFENRVLRKREGHDREEVRGGLRKFHMKTFIICVPHQILSGWSNQGKWDGQGMWHIWDRTEMQTGFWWGKLKERDHLEDIGIDGSLILKLILLISLNYCVYLNTRW